MSGSAFYIGLPPMPFIIQPPPKAGVAYCKPAALARLSKTAFLLTLIVIILPNNGDVAGFVSDIQDGLGLSGSSFNPSEFAEALSAFGGSNATGTGGPWEFFTEDVARSLAGFGPSPRSISGCDDDYIYEWLEMMQGRYASWK